MLRRTTAKPQTRIAFRLPAKPAHTLKRAVLVPCQMVAGGGCTDGSICILPARRRTQPVRPTMTHFALSCQTRCAPAGCASRLETEVLARSVMTQMVSHAICKAVDATRHECESWIVTSGSFCIVAPEFTKTKGNGKTEPGELQGISNFAIQWKCGDCGSGSVSTILAFDREQPTTSAGGQLEIRTCAPLMARSTCYYNKAGSTSGNSLVWMLRFSWLGFPCFHTTPATSPTPKACCLWINLAQTMQNTAAWRSLLRTAFGAARRPKAHGIPWKSQR